MHQNEDIATDAFAKLLINNTGEAYLPLRAVARCLVLGRGEGGGPGGIW